MLIRFDLWKDKLIKVKLPFEEPEEGELFECSRHRTRSYLHWNECWKIDEKTGKLVPYVGAVKKLYTILRFDPMTYSDFFKPIPREGKNMVKMDASSFRELHHRLARMVWEILDDTRGLMLYSSDAGAEVMLVKYYDARVPAVLLARQDNLELYEIPIMPKWIVRRIRKWKRGDVLSVGRHLIDSDVPFNYAISKRYTGKWISGLLVELSTPATVRIIHPSNQIKLSLNNGFYLIIHVQRYPRDD